MTNRRPHRPRVWLVGEYAHSDFAECVALLRADAELMRGDDVRVCPELIIVAQHRPCAVGSRIVELVRRRAPLAGVVSLLGSWCEGQDRASRPTHDTLRLYWYEFVPWWQRQLALRAAGKCPDWAWPKPSGLPPQSKRTRYSVPRTRGTTSNGLIALSTPRWETADVMSEVLQQSGYSTVWQPPGRLVPGIRGVAAGIWEGGQLDAREVGDLTAFCQQLAADSAPVIAVLDFPRRDRCDVARQAGAAAVLGKPWINANLVAIIRIATREGMQQRAA